MIRWIPVPRQEKTQVITLEYTVPYIIIWESDTIETQVVFSVIKFSAAETCFSMPKDKK